MTAPSAPRIIVRQDGTSIYVRWLPVLNATDYNLYVSEAGGAFGIQSQFADDDIEDDGWFFTIEGPFAGVVDVKMTALNSIAEESGYSNDRQVNLIGGRETRPTSAVAHARKIG
jgi:hypothetical protein